MVATFKEGKEKKMGGTTKKQTVYENADISPTDHKMTSKCAITALDQSDKIAKLWEC